MHDFIFDLSVVLVGTGILSILAVLLRQPIIVGYILCGVILGPWGLGLIKEVNFIQAISHLGITLLLFLAGLCLHPQHLFKLFKRTGVVTITNCALSFLIAFLFSFFMRFSFTDSVWIGIALMFSSTILTVKLLPTTKLHQERIGAVCISILIFQDLIAVGALAFLRGTYNQSLAIENTGWLLFKLVLLIAAAFLFERFALRKTLKKIDHLHEAIFITGLAWCFGVAAISNRMGLFYETGAFFAGVALAQHPIARFIADKLRPLRDFFLVLFFFALGAEFNLSIISKLFIPAFILAFVFIISKPYIFKRMLMLSGEQKSFATEAGIRLGQLSEFSLLVSLLALSIHHISIEASQFIQLVTIITFVVSSYYVVYRYKTPIGTTQKMFKD
ncbi:MAG: cation:proton antiporter [Candidatus Omnitrophica bacterium]|nr:cation:proton antiporter [Candidatus Omnitrophota bacterium]